MRTTTDGACETSLREAELREVLAAWHGATLRLEQTHESLRTEVRRLTQEIEAKNQELAKKSRLADLGQMASHIAHEVRNNLVPVKLYLGLLRRRLADDMSSLNILDKMTLGFTSLEATVNDLLSFTSDRDPAYGAVPVLRLVREVHEALQPQMEAQNIRVAIDVPPAMVVTADENMLRRAIVNLVLNALDAMPEGGELVITAHAGPHGLELEVADTGPGLSPATKQQVFEPFFTTKSGGTGLGLAIVSRIVEVHGGSVAASNCPEGGAAFTLVLPYPRREAAA